MDRQIIEISSDNFSLSLHRGFLSLTSSLTSSPQQIPLDNILSLILSADNAILSKHIINALTDQGACIILCGKNYIPASIIIPYANHWLIAPRVQAQLSCSKPLQKNIWKEIVQQKIYNQAKTLALFFPRHPNIPRLKTLAKETLSNDSQNNEGIAASLYFKSLFGKDFIRDRARGNINILLNYAYIVLRAMVLRAICGNGLLPYIGIKHCARANSFPLADDLMEPFRAYADQLVFAQARKPGLMSPIELTPHIKRDLACLVSMPIQTKKGCLSLNEVIYDFVGSLVKSFENKKVELDNSTGADTHFNAQVI